MKRDHPIYNFRFGLLCLSSLLFSSSYNLLIPELPSYLSGLGGSKYIGLIISLFTLTAGLSRPFSGVLTDRIGRRPVMIFGAMVCLVCGGMYPILSTVAGFLFLRLLHGFSTGFTPTAIAAYVSDIVPANRWGEAFGIQGVFFTSGLALGPALGSTIKLYYSYDILFYCSSALALLSMLLIFKLQETLPKTARFQWNMLKISRHDIISIRVAVPALMTFLSYFAFGMVLTLIPDWSEYLGFQNKGTFFVAFTVASLTIRFLAGSISDRVGRKIVVQWGLLLLIGALLSMVIFQNIVGLLFAAIVYGLAMGVLSPALNAWTVDLSSKSERGKGISTMFIALEAGIGLGALFSGWYYRDTFQNIPSIMLGCAFLAFLAFMILVFLKKKTR